MYSFYFDFDFLSAIINKSQIIVISLRELRSMLKAFNISVTLSPLPPYIEVIQQMLMVCFIDENRYYTLILNAVNKTRNLNSTFEAKNIFISQPQNIPTLHLMTSRHSTSSKI